jgi:hypothetical protein
VAELRHHRRRQEGCEGAHRPLACADE